MKINRVDLKTGKQIYNGDCSPLIGNNVNGIYVLYSEYQNRIFYIRIEDILIIECVPTKEDLEELFQEILSEEEN